MPSSPNGLRSDVISVEMGGISASVTLTHGAINIWFGRHAEDVLVSRILAIISRIDCATEHEKEVICDFEEINEFENNGYVLTSYARKDTKYRAFFVVPFSSPRALDRFVESVKDDLKASEVRMILHWRGGLARMRMLCEEMGRLNYFTFINPTYRDDNRS